MRVYFEVYSLGVTDNHGDLGIVLNINLSQRIFEVKQESRRYIDELGMHLDAIRTSYERARVCEYIARTRLEVHGTLEIRLRQSLSLQDITGIYAFQLRSIRLRNLSGSRTGI